MNEFWWKRRTAKVASLYSTLPLTSSQWNSDKREMNMVFLIFGNQVLQDYFGSPEGEGALQTANQQEQNYYYCFIFFTTLLYSSQGGWEWGMRQSGRWVMGESQQCNWMIQASVGVVQKTHICALLFKDSIAYHYCIDIMHAGLSE